MMWILNFDGELQQVALLNDFGIVGFGIRIKSESQ